MLEVQDTQGDASLVVCLLQALQNCGVYYYNAMHDVARQLLNHVESFHGRPTAVEHLHKVMELPGCLVGAYSQKQLVSLVSI